MKKIYVSLIVIGLIVVSCGGGDPQGRADDLCSCFKDAGLDFDGIENERDLERLGRKMEDLSPKKEKKAKECVLEVFKGVQSDVEDMNDEQTAEYMRSLVKGALDSECVVEAMEDVDYGDMKDLLDDLVDDLEDDMD